MLDIHVMPLLIISDTMYLTAFNKANLDAELYSFISVSKVNNSL
ncbi:hypothetical protein MAMP_02432 [Methylophaga aminisulfidivorans MP]|uniref:Uncharacterized protein n=1 Tax=Methylophaga aminisulfidivorans MP TaxID=1026882 RepID=F5SWN0_9GAMM|nr:hypothetical protein MAMP_02432 [Methylophaga aminisulfidivorans MP]